MAVQVAPEQVPPGFSTPLLECCPSRFLGIVGIFTIVSGLVLLMLGYEEVLPWIGGIVGAVLLIFGIALALNLLKTPYIVYPEGFLYYKRHHWSACPWADVKAIWQMTTITMHMGTLDGDRDHSCEILCQDDTRLKLKHIRNEGFIQWIEQEVYRSLVPRVQAQWASGQPIWFGPVSLSSVGVHTEREVLPWGDVQSVKPGRNENDIVIRKRGQQSAWKRLDGLEIANAALFFQLVQENLGAQNP